MTLAEYLHRADWLMIIGSSLTIIATVYFISATKDRGGSSKD